MVKQHTVTAYAKSIVSVCEVFFELGDSRGGDPFGDTGGSPPTNPFPTATLGCITVVRQWDCILLL